MTEQERKQVWERGQVALEKILRHVKIERVEELARRIDQKEFRDSMQYKYFMKSLDK